MVKKPILLSDVAYIENDAWWGWAFAPGGFVLGPSILFALYILGTLAFDLVKRRQRRRRERRKRSSVVSYKHTCNIQSIYIVPYQLVCTRYHIYIYIFIYIIRSTAVPRRLFVFFFLHTN